MCSFVGFRKNTDDPTCYLNWRMLLLPARLLLHVLHSMRAAQSFTGKARSLGITFLFSSRKLILSLNCLTSLTFQYASSTPQPAAVDPCWLDLRPAQLLDHGRGPMPKTVYTSCYLITACHIQNSLVQTLSAS